MHALLLLLTFVDIDIVNGFGWGDVTDAFEDATATIENSINEVFGENGLQKLGDSVEGVSGDISSILSDIGAIKTFFDSIKDNVADVLDDVDTVFNRDWYSIPDSTANGVLFYEAVTKLAESTGIPLTASDVPGVSGFCTFVTNSMPIKAEWLNFLKAGAELFTKFLTSNRRRLKSFKQYHETGRRLQSDWNTKACIDSVVESNFTLCNYAEAAYTSGIWYDYVVKEPLTLDLTTDISDFVNIGGAIISNELSYTDGNLLAFFKLLHTIIDVHLGVVDHTCTAAVDLADPLVTDCAAAIICTAVRNIFNTINEYFGYILSNADYHDALTLATQMQAVFDNRQRIIQNQKKIKHFAHWQFNDTNKLITHKVSILTATMNNEFGITDSLITNEIVAFTQAMNDAFNSTKELFVEDMNQLTETMDIQFDDTQTLINNEFDTLTNYLNAAFANMFDRLTIIDKLLRTAPGKRPGWNEQTFNAMFGHQSIDQHNSNHDMVEITQTELLIIGGIGTILFCLVVINQIIIFSSKTL